MGIVIWILWLHIAMVSILMLVNVLKVSAAWVSLSVLQMAVS